MAEHTDHLRKWMRLPAGMFLVAQLIASPATGQVSDDPIERHISVSGEGTVRAAPDLAHADLGIRVVAPTVDEAMQETRQRMARITASLREAGIPERDIATSRFSIHRERQIRPNRGRGDQDGAQPDQYVVTNTVRVSIRDLDRAALVVDGAIDAGANEMRGIYFALEDTEDVERRARKLAACEARDRATQLADLHGVKLGSPLRISETPGGTGERLMMARASASSAEGSTVSRGELTFRVQLHVVYELVVDER